MCLGLAGAISIKTPAGIRPLTGLCFESPLHPFFWRWTVVLESREPLATLATDGHMVEPSAQYSTMARATANSSGDSHRYQPSRSYSGAGGNVCSGSHCAYRSCRFSSRGWPHDLHRRLVSQVMGPRASHLQLAIDSKGAPDVKYTHSASVFLGPRRPRPFYFLSSARRISFGLLSFLESRLHHSAGVWEGF